MSASPALRRMTRCPPSNCGSRRSARRRKFQRAHRRGSDGHDPAPGSSRALDSLRGILRNLVPLAMQFVLLNHFFAYGLKRPQSHMQRDFGHLSSLLGDPLKNFRREVQACCRRGNRAQRFRVNRLIRLPVGGDVGTIDVRRQWNVADAIEHAEEVVHGIEAKMALAKSAAAHDFGREFVRRFVGLAAEIDSLAQSELAAGMDQRFPLRRMRGDLPGQQHFDPTTQERLSLRDFQSRAAAHASRYDVRRDARETLSYC